MTDSILRVLRPLALLTAFGAVIASAQPAPPPPAPATQGSSQGSSGPEVVLPGTAAERDAVTKGNLTLEKFNKIDILGKLLPVALTKEEIRALLPAIQKARQTEFATRVLDAAEITKLDAEVTAAAEAGTTKNEVPSPELQNRIRKVTGAILVRRQIATNEMIDVIYAACQKTLDAGQLKVMASTLKPELIQPGIKIEGDEANIRFFIRYIFLDGLTYDMLRQMAKPA